MIAFFGYFIPNALTELGQDLVIVAINLAQVDLDDLISAFNPDSLHILHKTAHHRGDDADFILDEDSPGVVFDVLDDLADKSLIL